MKDTKGVRQVLEELVGADERIDIQSEFDKVDVPHLETDRYPGLDGVRQASRNLLRNNQRQKLPEAEAALQEIMLGMLPEEKRLCNVEGCDDHGGLDERYVEAWNAALKTIKQNIRGGFNNGV